MSFEFKKSGIIEKKPENKILNFLKNLRKSGGIPLKEKIFFVQNLRVMIKSGLALATALKTLHEQTSNKHFKKIILDLLQATEKGNAFSDSLAKYQSIFGDLFVNMIKAGEASGRLDEVLGELFVQMKKDHDLRAKIKGAMTYPVVILIAMIGISTGMMIFVVPKLVSIFEEMNAKLPLFTRILIKVSNLIVTQGPLVAGLVFVVVFSVIIFFKTKNGIYTGHWLMLNSPVLGPIVKKINLARFTRTISSLIKTDIPIVQTFRITSQVLGNVFYREALERSTERLTKGEPINKILADYPKLFPPVVKQMTAVGEETGSVDVILSDLAVFYEDDIDETMKTLPTIIEPVLMIILGFGVGAIAVAIIMPMYSLTSQI